MRFSALEEALIKSGFPKLFFIFAMVLIFFAASFGASFAAYAAPDYAAPPDVKAPSAILIDADTGEALFEKDADAPREPASLAKVMTALLAIEALPADEALTMDREVYNVGDRQIYLQIGEELTADELLYAALLYSANDAAVALAKAVSGSVPDFAGLMNEKARALGCKGTNFVNPNGLAAEGQVSTARDLALIARAALQNERFRGYVSTVSHTIPATNRSGERPLQTLNLLLTGAEEDGDSGEGDGRTEGDGSSVSRGETDEPSPSVLVYGARAPLKYDGATGVKTGRTDTSGACLIASAERDGKSYIAVALADEPQTWDEYADAITLLEYAFNGTEPVEVFSDVAAEQETGLEDLPVLKIGAAETRALELRKTRMGEWAAGHTYEYVFDEGLAAPLHTGDVVGKIACHFDGDIVYETDMIALQDVEAKKGFFESIGFDTQKGFSFYIKAGAAVIVLLVIILLIALIRHRYTHDPYVRRVRYGRVTREIKRVRKMK
ncbi:MAG: D-alanyl-D-alanine carboxypeptidase [Clostridiales Family XIII bacterium]|jgi:D-alanyl-D-alanine carboxypeptidase (penicillin-binding protein 5/6)|nr:D-alanyl-D-alanine carboxypeptidase [Clostridiales Family XIII bacterium]